jgi:catecholate siderophore receptor
VAPRWTVGGGLNYVSRRFGNTANTRSVPSYWLVDGMLEFRPTKHIELRLNAKNLFDETYYLKPYTTHYATVGPGRAFILTAGFSY